MKNKKFFFENLIKWNKDKNVRQMPWKGEKDPYKIWISEIILQQTRVQQGLEYYNRFIIKYPNVESLAVANDQDVYKLWEGLGYYSRCRNILASAKYIFYNLKGIFPGVYEDILSLKGIGNYTASAIASFAFNQPYAVLDGNVFRVLARFFGIEIPIDTTKGKKLFSLFSQKLIDKKNPAAYNQAIMDFGAVVCKPALPLCDECLLQKKCIAYKKGMVNRIPVKEKSIKKRNRFFNYLIIEQNNKIFVRQRTTKDIWQNLYEFVLIETENFIPEKIFLQSGKFESIFKEHMYIIQKVSDKLYQKLTHQTITGRFFYITLQGNNFTLKNYKAVNSEELELLPFPKFINAYLKDKNVSLNLFTTN